MWGRSYRGVENIEMPEQTPDKDAARRIVESLNDDDRILITLRDEIFDGSWEKFLEDLEDRLKGRPYIFKLVSRIQDDIERIHKLREYEQRYKINLADYISGGK
jgi:hypothetical protein